MYIRMAMKLFFKELEKTGIVKFFKNAEDALSAISDISEQSTRTKSFEKALKEWIRHRCGSTCCEGCNY